MKALLLCAGRGSRLHPYTRNNSKVCLPFLNIPIAAYPLKLLEDLGVSHLLVNTHHQVRQVVDLIEFLLALPNQSLDFVKAGTPSSSVIPAGSVIPAQPVIPAGSVIPAKAGTSPSSVISAGSVIPAKAGTSPSSVIPAKAGTSSSSIISAGSVIPAKAGTSPNNNTILNLSFVYEPHLLEGLGTLRKNADFFKGEEDIIYLNGDSVFLCEDFFSQMLAQHKQKKALMTLLCSPFQKGASHLWANEEGRIVPSGNAQSHQPCFFAGFVLVNQKCFSLFQKSDNHLFRDFVKRHSDRCFIYMQKDLKFFELGSLSCYMKALHTCSKYLENPLSKEAGILNKTLNRYLSAEFMQDRSHFNLNYLRRLFFAGRVFQKEQYICGD